MGQRGKNWQEISSGEGAFCLAFSQPNCLDTYGNQFWYSLSSVLTPPKWLPPCHTWWAALEGLTPLQSDSCHREENELALRIPPAVSLTKQWTHSSCCSHCWQLGRWLFLTYLLICSSCGPVTMGGCTEPPIPGHPGMPGSSDQRVLCYWAPQDVYYIRPLLSRPGDLADLLIT